MVCCINVGMRHVALIADDRMSENLSLPECTVCTVCLACYTYSEVLRARGLGQVQP